MNTIELICSGCGNHFNKNISEYNRTKRENGLSMYCSRQCAGKYIPRPNKKYKPIISECILCKLKFNTTNHPKGRKCCSIICAKTISSLSWSRKTEEFSKTMSQSNKKAWSEGKYKLTNSGKRKFNSIGEIELREYLKENLPDYGFTCGMLGFNTGLGVDIVSKLYKIIVEYDGIWHFKDIKGQLLDKQEKDKKLEDWCIKNGWRCIRIKEEIYKSDKNLWKKHIKDEILNGTDLIVKYYT